MINISKVRKMESTEQIEAIADYYGLEICGRQLQEECAELIQAVSKLYRTNTDEERKKAIDHASEELADVDICMSELCHLLNNGCEVGDWMDKKLGRQLDRIEELILC